MAPLLHQAPLMHQPPLMLHHSASRLEAFVLLTKTAVDRYVTREYVIHNQITELPQNSGFEIKPHTL